MNDYKEKMSTTRSELTEKFYNRGQYDKLLHSNSSDYENKWKKLLEIGKTIIACESENKISFTFAHNDNYEKTIYDECYFSMWYGPNRYKLVVYGNCCDKFDDDDDLYNDKPAIKNIDELSQDEYYEICKFETQICTPIGRLIEWKRMNKLQCKIVAGFILSTNPQFIEYIKGHEENFEIDDYAMFARYCVHLYGGLIRHLNARILKSIGIYAKLAMRCVKINGANLEFVDREGLTDEEWEQIVKVSVSKNIGNAIYYE
jgi:hypothetical protein